METSGLTILLFFVLVTVLLAAFVLYLLISHRTTPVAQRLTLWLKTQREADQLVDTMAAQSRCILDGLTPCHRRKRRRQQLAQRRRQNSSHGREENTDMRGPVVRTEFNEGMDDPWRRTHLQRPERSDPQQDIAATGQSAGSDGTGRGSRKAQLSDELAGEKLWEFVAGWCLVGCIFAGIALIVGANCLVQSNVAADTPWDFDVDEGDSLMDSIIAHIMRVALGLKDFEDELMEHGIFVFVAGINGFVLVRQRVFVRRHQHEIQREQGELVMLGPLGKDVPFDEEYCAELAAGATQGLTEVYQTQDLYSRLDNALDNHTGDDDTVTKEGLSEGGELASGSTQHKGNRAQQTLSGSKEDQPSVGESPDFRTMSFLAWFNYLQVGILVIEFLQLFSFPLRELIEFYNQAEKTNAMYESARGIVNVLQTAATSAGTSTGHLGQDNRQGLHYQNGTLSFGNNTLFNFHGGEDTGSSMGSAGPTLQAALESIGNNTLHPVVRPVRDSSRAWSLSEVNTDLAWLERMPVLENATALAMPWIKNSTTSADWIEANLPLWLPNITQLMFNSSMTDLAQKNMEGIKDQIINAAASVALQGLPRAATAGEQHSSGTSSHDSSVDSNNKHTSIGSDSDGDIVMQVVNSLGLQPSINTHNWYLLRFWSCFAVVLMGWLVALTIHGWNRRCRRLRREGKPHWPALSVGWISCFIPVVSVLYLPILSTFLSSAACQSQAIYAYAYERHALQHEEAMQAGHGPISTSGVFQSVVVTLLDPALTVSHPVTSLLCTGPKVQPLLYLAASLIAYTLAYLLFMVFLTSFERQPAKGEICFRPNGVAVLKNLGLLLAVDFLLIQSPAQRRFRGLVSIAIMLAMACYTIRMKPCYWNKINYWRTFSFSCVLYASLLVALLCPSPAPDKVRGERIGGHWVMAPHLKMGHAWVVGGGPKVMLAWIAAGWALLIIAFFVVDRVLLRHWTKNECGRPTGTTARSEPPLLPMSMYRSDETTNPNQTKFSTPQTQGEASMSSAISNALPSGSHWSIADLGSKPSSSK